jgi:hypothetical protein
MASAIAEHLDQFQAESNQSNDFHSRRATVDYIPKAHSKLPFNYAPVAWPVIDSDQYCHLSDGARVLYTYLCRHIDLRIKQQTRGQREYLMGRTFAKKYEIIAEECWRGRKSTRSIRRYVSELAQAELIEVQKGWGKVCTFTLMAFHQTEQIEEYETNAVEREYQIQQAALRNNKLRLLRQEKEEVIEVEAPNFTAQKEVEVTAEGVESELESLSRPLMSSPDQTPVSCPITIETNLTETSSPNTQIPTQLEFHSSSDDNYHQLKLQTLELWCQQQHKLGNLAPSAGDRYQIMRHDHQLGIDAFVAEAIRLSPNLTPTQALNLLQSCIKIMPKTGGNSRPVGRPGWFLLSASETYFKRAWSNTFDFLPPHWQNQYQSASRRAFNRPKPRASHF